MGIVSASEKRLLYRTALFLVFLFAAAGYSDAQPALIDSKGTDFWLAFPPNLHQSNRFVDSLYIFIAADKPSSGTISFIDRNGNETSTPFSISDPTKLHSFRVWYEGAELIGYNAIEVGPESAETEMLSRRSFHIRSDNEVTVYALSQAVTTSDAFMVLPTDALGTDYVVMSYKSDGHLMQNNPGEIDETFSTPSQFAIVATEDGTNVTIIPSARTYRNGLNIQQLTLNKGQTYLVQADISPGNLNGDLTGTRIGSDKPVAVFSGHQRATVPITTLNNPSRDYLAEQLTPVNTWGRTAFLTPLRQPAQMDQPLIFDLFRVVAALDNTVLSINGVQVATLQAGQFYEGELKEALFVSATQPILAAALKRTSRLSNATGPGNFVPGDPFMMLVPPSEQFMSSYRFTNVQIFAQQDEGVYSEQYMNIVFPTAAKASIKIDGVAAGFPSQQIFTTDFSYGILEMEDGAHTISADVPIGIYVYGYGRAISYGYIGGMSFRGFDYKPPRLLSSRECFKISGTAYDNSQGDSRIKSLSTPPDSQLNIRSLFTEPFSGYVDSVRFSAELANPYSDGSFVISAQDSVGNSMTERMEIPGFTLNARPYTIEDNVFPRDSVRLPAGRRFCSQIVVYNYGKFRQGFSPELFSGSAFTLSGNIPDSLNPGDSAVLTVCFTSKNEGIFTDTLFLRSSCLVRKVYAIQAESRADKEKPELSMEKDPCNTRVSLTFTDSSFFDRQLQFVEPVEALSRNILYQSRGGNFPVSAGYTAEVIDPYQDAVYAIRAQDSAGNVTFVNDTIPGYTLQIMSLPDSVSHNFGTGGLGDQACDTIMLHNYGSFPMVLGTAELDFNTDFSVPLSQLPLTLAPGETKALGVCFRPVLSREKDFVDTLRLRYNCSEKKIALRGASEILVRNGETRCNVPVVFTSAAVPFHSFLEQNYPNPARQDAIITFGLSEKQDIDLRLFDLYGNERLRIGSGKFEPGMYTLQVPVENLPAGMYIYELRMHGEKISRSMSVVK